MIRKLLSKFRKHDYRFIKTTDTCGKIYFCANCGEKINIPLEWTYQFPDEEIKKLKGCNPV